MAAAEEKWNKKGLSMWDGWTGARKGIPVYNPWLCQLCHLCWNSRSVIPVFS